MTEHLWRVRGREIDLSARTLVMGILNVTPDSFSDCGQFASPAEAVRHGISMADAGADIIDIGGESTRPGRPDTLDTAEECRRVLPVLSEIRKLRPEVLLSVDTYREETARRALDEGADVINDVYAFRRSPGMAALAAASGAGVILMHMQGDPETMQQDPQYGDVLVEVKDMLQERIRTAADAGVAEEQVVVDPGIGFGKTLEHNLKLLAGLEYLRLLQRPICIGVSRKGFLGKLTGDLPVSKREEATIAASSAAVLNGASIVRVHNVTAAKHALAVIDAIRALQ
jgi:dihydropteroate synthase